MKKWWMHKNHSLHCKLHQKSILLICHWKREIGKSLAVECITTMLKLDWKNPIFLLNTINKKAESIPVKYEHKHIRFIKIVDT